MTDAVFFGVACGNGAGHHFYVPSANGRAFRTWDAEAWLSRALVAHPSPDGRWCYEVPRTSDQLRKGACAQRDETQGRAFIHFAHGWTIISWWDRSEDRRAGSNAVFFLRGYRQWAEAFRRAREAFPQEIARMEAAYTIKLAGADLPEPGDSPEASFEAAVTREVDRLRSLHPAVLDAVLRRMDR